MSRCKDEVCQQVCHSPANGGQRAEDERQQGSKQPACTSNIALNNAVHRWLPERQCVYYDLVGAHRMQQLALMSETVVSGRLTCTL